LFFGFAANPTQIPIEASMKPNNMGIYDIDRFCGLQNNRVLSKFGQTNSLKSILYNT